ncbi:J domain-containing protein required for chloroplast accumulation response 1 [Platanthera zijinensis]|uniref:J domain-containing protein required for chloroplast accumulation response 1 n=1 Tax=Platanthera zijinensis TaxID=2320716 RepID=A0AAP0B8U8_9ASPA
MESASERERILLGYPARSHRRNLEVDFLDVFGGQPRRSSVYESRRSQGDSIDSCSGPNRGWEDWMGSRRSRFESAEKPVFGDGRRQQLRDDFFGDIFQISKSACSSPRKADSDPLMSYPSSRVSSPNRPTLPSWEPLFGGPSFRTPSSLSEPMDKDFNHPVFHSPSSPNVSSTVPFTKSVEGHGDLRNNGYGSYRQTPLSHRVSHGLEGFSVSEGMEPALNSQTGESSSSLEDYINNRQFHFSIYKWAGKGVMLVMPSDSNERNEFEGRLARLPEVIVQELELSTHYDYFSSVTKPLKSGTVIGEDKSDKRDDDYAEITAKISQVVTGLKLLKSDANKTSGKYDNKSEKTSVPGFEEISSTNSTDGEQSSQSWVNLHCEQNRERKNISQMLDDDIGKQRSRDISEKAKEREVPSKSRKKQQLLRESKLVPGELNSTTFHDIPSFSEDKPLHKVKGKVKEFIKKFNHEALPKRKGAFEMQSPRSKSNDSRHDKIEELAYIFSTETDKLQENQVKEKAEVEKSSIFGEVHTINDRPSEERVEVLHQQSELTPEDHKNVEWYEEIIQEGFEEYLVQQLPVNYTEDLQNNSEQDQIKISDANIRQWSKGKEGNIRSLLSTLQLVLWPESGWKQVPLVSIIEAPSVKKAYQKALLCLHPDKLQQKGASSNQKYIAEKVFDILQEAWDHFNSVSQF